MKQTKKEEELKRIKKVYKYIRRNGIPFGSRVLGVARPDSDYDYLLRPDDFYHLVRNNLLATSNEGYEYQNETGIDGEVKIIYKGKTINVVCAASDDHFQARKYAIDIMRYISTIPTETEKNPLSDKNSRVVLFRALVNCYLIHNPKMTVVPLESPEFFSDEDIPF